MVGSDILFLRLYEFRPQFIAKGEALQNNYAQHMKKVRALILLKEKEIEFSKNIALIKEIRMAILHTYTRI